MPPTACPTPLHVATLNFPTNAALMSLLPEEPHGSQQNRTGKLREPVSDGTSTRDESTDLTFSVSRGLSDIERTLFLPQGNDFFYLSQRPQEGITNGQRRRRANCRAAVRSQNLVPRTTWGKLPKDIKESSNYLQGALTGQESVQPLGHFFKYHQPFSVSLALKWASLRSLLRYT